MPTNHRRELARIKRFDQLVAYLRDEMDWPIEGEDFEDLTFEYSPEELGIDAQNAAKIQEIKRLRPLTPEQPWGIFFVKFEPKRLPVMALRRILSRVVLKKQAAANSVERAAWQMADLLFISNHGGEEERRISFAHFVQDAHSGDLPTLKVLGWDEDDTGLHLDHVAAQLTRKLRWPEDEADIETWRQTWAGAFTLSNREVITTSKRLAEALAALARATYAKMREALAIEAENGPLRTLMDGFKKALIHDLDEDGFADMYAQTIAYGLLSARISRQSGFSFIAENMSDMVPVTNPFLKEMLESFLKLGGRRRSAQSATGIDFDELGINEMVELLRDANMEAVVRDFGDKNPEEDPVIHFYEDFIALYDPKRRKQRGIFYTPRPVVSYIVRSVDELLRTEFGLEDGLADTTTWGEMAARHADLRIPDGVSPDQAFVQILDPATGTGTFIVEVIELIHRTMVAKWKAQGHRDKQIVELWNEYVPAYLLPRVHGYELLMAPYAIAHLKIGLKLHETGYRFGSDERARVYLTNALEPASDRQMTLDFLPALAHEAQSVNKIKREQYFSVIIGNPPYSERSENRGAWISERMEHYKKTIRSQEAQIKAVSNDYVKFMRFCHYLADRVEAATIGLITGNGYLDGRLFRDMRGEWLESFEKSLILNLHGSGRRGDATYGDENVFDILQGVCINISKNLSSFSAPEVFYGEMIGLRKEKYLRLIGERTSCCSTLIHPSKPLFLFTPDNASKSTLHTWSLDKLFGTGNPTKDRNRTYAGGFKTRQDRFAVAFEKDTLKERIAELADSAISESVLRKKYSLCSTAHFVFEKARAAAKSGKLEKSILSVRYRPFDDRPMIWAREVLCEPQTQVTRHLFRKNLCLVTSRVVKDNNFRHVSISRGPVEVISISNSTSTNAYMFPLYRYEKESQECLAGLDCSDVRIVNLNKQFMHELNIAIRNKGEKGNAIKPESVVYYIYAVMHSPNFRIIFADDLLRDFPKIPMPNGIGIFESLSQLGEMLVAIHLMESDQLYDSDLDSIGLRKTKVSRVGWSDETVWLDAGKTNASDGHHAEKPGTAGFKGVPEAVWNFHIGGYQVCHKWLKDRKGRTLSDDDITHYQKIIVAIRETIRTMGEIDAVIEEHGGWPGAFVTRVASEADHASVGSQQASASALRRSASDSKIGSDSSAGALETTPDEAGRSFRDGLSVVDATDLFGKADSAVAFTTRTSSPQPAQHDDVPADFGELDAFEETGRVASVSPEREELICQVRQYFAGVASQKRDVAIKELASLFGYLRTGRRIRESIDNALRTAVRRGILVNHSGELSLATGAIEHYERAFLKEQFLAALVGYGWVEREDSIRAFSRWLGFSRTGSKISETAHSLISALLREKRLEADGTWIRRAR
jgi:hypothetical protein